MVASLFTHCPLITDQSKMGTESGRIFKFHIDSINCSNLMLYTLIATSRSMKENDTNAKI